MRHGCVFPDWHQSSGWQLGDAAQGHCQKIRQHVAAPGCGAGAGGLDGGLHGHCKHRRPSHWPPADDAPGAAAPPAEAPRHGRREGPLRERGPAHQHRHEHRRDPCHRTRSGVHVAGHRPFQQGQLGRPDGGGRGPSLATVHHGAPLVADEPSRQHRVVPRDHPRAVFRHCLALRRLPPRVVVCVQHHLQLNPSLVPHEQERIAVYEAQ
mmetsp:Transcript_142317/g.396578  ORF Transcript_142317/g.396578 Transcript_142317/m.396578 type:complete len:209 (+) Transcript_142317:966-1592(+)